MSAAFYKPHPKNMFNEDFNSNNTFESLFRKPSSVSCDDGNRNPISKKDDGEHPSFFLNIPSPQFFDEHELSLNQMLSHSQIMDHQQYQVCAGCNQIEHNATDSTKKEIIMKKSSSTTKAGSKLNSGKVAEAVKRRRNLAAIPRKRAGKKDRHSKICTAQGVRDRRMRLSLQVARKFFDLQDLLGYDKASKTIEWLFNKSKKAIKDLTKDHPLSCKDVIHTSSRTELETKSGKDVILSRTEEEAKKDIDMSVDVKGPLMIDLKDKRISRKGVSRVNTRESREKARARARCRTKEKMMIKIMENMSHLCESSANHLDPDKLVSLKGIDQDSSGCHGQEVLDLGGIEKLLCSANSSSPSSSSLQVSDYHSSGALTGCVDPNSNLRGFSENWDLMNSYDDILNKSTTTHYADVTNEVAFAGNNTISSSIYSASSPNYGSLFHQ